MNKLNISYSEAANTNLGGSLPNNGSNNRLNNYMS